MALLELIFLIISCIVAYFVGSISPSIAISKAKGVDITTKGSGNAGSTNTLRVLGPKVGLSVFLLDFIKGFVVVFVAHLLFGDLTSYFAGIFVILGHIFSIYHHFKAGKGVATGIGVLFAVNWIIGAICLGFGILLIVITRRVSVGSVIAGISIPLVTWFFDKDFFIFAILITLILLFTHRSNIKRLLKGEEKPLW